MKYILDTNIIIYFLKGTYPEIQNKLLHIPSKDICLSSITLAELEYGAQNSSNYEKSIAKIKAFASAFGCLNFTADAAPFYGKLRADLKKTGTPIGADDMLIAATALANNAVLVTHNTKEFAGVEGLTVEDWCEK